MLYREEKPTSGQILVGGIDVAKLRNSKVYKLRRKKGFTKFKKGRRKRKKKFI